MGGIMDDKSIITYTENTELIEDQKYIVECGIEFTYKPCEEKPTKPYLLNNGYRLDHIPTSKDVPTNNLVNMKDRTMKERRAIGSKGKAQATINNQKRKSFKESMDFILSCKASAEEIESLPLEIQEQFRNIGYIPTKEDLINIRAVELAIVGSDKHMVFSRDTVGEKPTDNTNINANVMTDGDNALLEKIAKRLLIEHQE